MVIEFLRRSDLDVKSKYFFIVMAYHSSRPNEGAGSTLEAIIKRIGFSKSAARKAIKELHNARIIDLDYSLNEKMTSRCELERFNSSFLDLPVFLINYIDSDSIRKKTIDTEKNNNTSVVNKDNLSFQEFVCSFYIWVAKNKETGVCLIPYKEIGDVINGRYQTVRRVLNKISIIKIPDFNRFIVMFIKGTKTKNFETLSFCVVNPILINKDSRIDGYFSKNDGRTFITSISNEVKFPSVVFDFMDVEIGKNERFNGILSLMVTRILNNIFNNNFIVSLQTNGDFNITSFKYFTCYDEFCSILNSKNIEKHFNIISFLSLCIVRYILKFKVIKTISPDGNFSFLFVCDEVFSWDISIIEMTEDERCSLSIGVKNDSHIRRVKIVNLMIDYFSKLITVE